MGMQRLDKLLAGSGAGTRSEVKKLIRSGRVFVNGIPAKRPEDKADPDSDEVLLDGKSVKASGPVYLMLNKPSGVVSATSDRDHRTVLDLVDPSLRKDLFPAGRLDIDTEGLLLLTNDGSLAHELLSPGKHVEKTYLVRVTGEADESLVPLFLEGFDIGEKRRTLPARLRFLDETSKEPALYGFTADRPEDPEEEPASCLVTVTITEGKYHQVKRMFAAAGRKVLSLKRIAMGSLTLDPELKAGKYRPLTPEELDCLKEK